MKPLRAGTAHDHVPPDMDGALRGNKPALVVWDTLTPLARNEWICWVISPKRQSTRNEHVSRMVNELAQNVRRPCCWLGCIHRTDKPLSPSVRAILHKKAQ